MERLPADDKRLSELSIHLGRYLTAYPFARGASVLDIACGTGYGSSWLGEIATRVVGIDVSSEAIHEANEHFSSPNITFIQHSADGELLDIGRFDVVVCLETIEHVSNPRSLLRNLQSYVEPEGTIIISCPNDAWYYGAGEGNPYHLHKWTFEEFKEFSEGELGPAATWLAGYPGYTYTNRSLDDGNQVGVALSLSSSRLSANEAAYFVGVWGPLQASPTSTSAALGMTEWFGTRHARSFETPAALALEIERLCLQLSELRAEVERLSVASRTRRLFKRAQNFFVKS